MQLLVGLVLGLLAGAVATALLLRRGSAPAPATTSPEPTEPVVGPVEEHAAVFPSPLAEAVDRIEHGVVIVDGNGEELYRNPAAERVGTARDSRTLVDRAVTRLLESARAGHSEREAVELFGPPAQLFIITAHPYAHSTGTGALAVVEDRSDARRTETVRRDFVANISHELKTPIGALGLLAETIREETDPEVMQRLAGRMVSESDRAARTIDDLLELSRIEFGDDAEFAALDVIAVVGEAMSRISNAAEQAKVEIRADVPADLVITGDRRQLVSAVFNLLDNAVKYSPEGTAVDVRAFREPATDVVALSVEDHGIGIPRRSLDRIFERFYRVDRARSRNTGGTGLGLAIVRHVVSNHGGQVLAESVEGQGSVFTLLLPAQTQSGSAGPSVPRSEVHST